MTSDTIKNKFRPARVLLIEDNHGDVILCRRAFQEAKIATQLQVATTGEDAIDMLYKNGQWAKIETPDLILLDINLPQMNGQEVLKVIKESIDLRHIPVIILSSSNAEHDVVESYNLHANGYVVKPSSMEHFSEMVQKLAQFWFTLVVMPDAGYIQQAS